MTGSRAGARRPWAPAPQQPFKEKVGLEDFQRLDLRVCEVTKCQEIKKSNNCLKLTLNDGAGERVIVSSIRGDYAPEELVGRKIVVVANLAPARITGVTSSGMLLAATDGEGRNQVLFVDPAIPNGTVIH
jgi:lysyl-tRNA synthetase class 1